MALVWTWLWGEEGGGGGMRQWMPIERGAVRARLWTRPGWWAQKSGQFLAGPAARMLQVIYDGPGGLGNGIKAHCGLDGGPGQYFNSHHTIQAYHLIPHKSLPTDGLVLVQRRGSHGPNCGLGKGLLTSH